MKALRFQFVAVAVTAFSLTGLATQGFAQKAPDASTNSPLAAGQYKSEAEAKTACGADPVVWANIKRKKYHTTASPDYGKTKTGAYMCEKNAASSGFKAVKANKKT